MGGNIYSSQKEIFLQFLSEIKADDELLLTEIFRESFEFHNPQAKELEIYNLTQADVDYLQRFNGRLLIEIKTTKKEFKKILREVSNYIQWRLKQPFTDRI